MAETSGVAGHPHGWRKRAGGRHPPRLAERTGWGPIPGSLLKITRVTVVEASTVLSGSVQEAEAVWYDTSRWPHWVAGLARVQSSSEEWPAAGQVRWESSPAGRGEVIERVVSYEPLGGQTVEVEDDSIRGRQTVFFEPQNGGVTITLSLAYELKRRSPLLALVNLLFIRRAMTQALEQTLSRFGAELQASRRPDVR